MTLTRRLSSIFFIDKFSNNNQKTLPSMKCSKAESVSVKPKLLITWRCGGGGHGQRCATLRVTQSQSARTQHCRGGSTNFAL